MREQRRSAAMAQCLASFLAIFLLAIPATAGISGAIYTSDSTGTSVNQNSFPTKLDAYLDGGPQNSHGNGLPDGTYYFQVTDPSGNTLLSLDPLVCRQVTVTGGSIVGRATSAIPSSCDTSYPPQDHPNGTFNAANMTTPVQLFPFSTTPNGGGVYKVWLISQDGSCNTTSSDGYTVTFDGGCKKTDNFKIQADVCTVNCTPSALISGAKFYDFNADGTRTLPDDQGLANWEIVVSYVAGGAAVSAEHQFTNAMGLWSVSADQGTQITACEILQTGWKQSGPTAASLVSGIPSIDTPSPAYAPKCWQGTVPNVDTAGLDFGNYTELTVSKTAVPQFLRTYTWTIGKTGPGEQDTSSGTSVTLNYTVTATETGFTDSAFTVAGTITVSNLAPVAFTNVKIEDLIDNGGVCSFSGSASALISIPAAVNNVAGTASASYSCAFATNPGSGTNTGKATPSVDPADHNPSTPNASFTGTAPYTFTGVTPAKKNDVVTVTDTFGGLATKTLDNALAATDSAPFTTKQYADSYTVNAPVHTCTIFSNTAAITGVAGPATVTVKVCGASPLTVTKTAVTSYTSSITKSVDKTLVEQPGGSASFNYTVKVTTGAWAVNGNITVTNPNDWEDITATVTDNLSVAGATCVVNGGSNSPTVTRGLFATLPYTCAFSAVPGANGGSNTATANWSGAFTATNTASSNPVLWAFSPLTVTDCFGPLTSPATACTTNTLGTVTIPPGSATFTYARTLTALPGKCQEYDNTAAIAGGATAKASATICNTNTGALSKGFWQNKNGQGIITSYCSGTSGTSLHAFLTSLNPFKDDSAASCKDEAAYVLKIIQAATCGGTTCNPMLKAQMLGTALDVYFSDPVLGGNRIGGYNGLGNQTPAIGGVAIDLSKTCSMIDSSDTCSGTTEDARPEFGLASPLIGTTVMQMLLYSNFPSAVNGNPVSNAGGGSWYQQVKTPKQVYAKDSFDAIDNSVANIAPGNVGSPSF